jgi:uncharacterized protein (DUF58 family)
MLKGFYLTSRFFIALGLATVLLILGYVFTPLMYAGIAVASLVLIVTVADGLLLWRSGELPTATRTFPEQLSLGDDNTIHLEVRNNADMAFHFTAYEEAPEQLQLRNLKFSFALEPGSRHNFSYIARPTERGKYHFGHTVLFLRSFLGFAERKIKSGQPQEGMVFPSLLQMKEFELKVMSKTATLQGIKKIRRLGQSSEFEQIRNYVQGDEVRTVNWRATGRRNELMVNQYEDERAQNIFCVIDKSRVMKSPFHGLSLLDHAINSTLVISNISMLKGDRAGLITFSDKLGARLQPGRGNTHLRFISKTLYDQHTDFLEANYEILYYGIRKYVRSRSMLMLFTNFESLYNLQSVLPLLRMINKQHLLVVVFFEDNELTDAGDTEADTMLDIYSRTMAQRFAMEKELIVAELNKFGIQSVLTRPEQLSVNAINKYLELKSRGMI